MWVKEFSGFFIPRVDEELARTGNYKIDWQQAYGGDLKQDNDGATVVVKGAVRDPAGNPISGAEIEIWQTADNGLYSNQDPQQPAYNLRARLKARDNGDYAFTTVRPAPYTVPFALLYGRL